MTWNANKPADNDSPGVAPVEIRTNWARLQAMITADHLFNATSPTPNNDGYHKVVHWVTQGTAPSSIDGTGLTYTKEDTVTRDEVDQTAPHLFHRTYDGTTEITSPMTQAPIRAFVNFDGTTTGSGATQMIRSSYNVISVTRIGTNSGWYEITFTNVMPTNTYAVIGTAQRSGVTGTGKSCYVAIRDVAYTTAVTTSTVQIVCSSDGTNPHDANMCNVIIVGG